MFILFSKGRKFISTDLPSAFLKIGIVVALTAIYTYFKHLQTQYNLNFFHYSIVYAFFSF